MKSKASFMVFLVIILSSLPAVFAHDASEAPVDARIVAARARVETATRQLDAAKRELESLRSPILRQFEARREWGASKQRLDEAQGELERKKLAAMTMDPHYAALVLQRDKARAIVGALPTGPGEAQYDNTDKAFKDKFEAEASLRMIEDAVEAEDPDVIAAKKKLDEAKGVWDGLQALFSDAVKRSPGYPDIQRQFDKAQSEYEDAKVEMNAARKAAKPIEIAQPQGHT